MRRAVVRLLACSLAGCGAAPEPPPASDDTDVEAFGVAESSVFNRDGVTHHAQYIRLKDGSAEVRDVGFAPIGFTAHDTAIPGHCSATKPCVRLQGLEAVETGGGTTYYMWGYGGNRSGHVHVADLAERPDVDVAKRAGNGKPCAVLAGQNGEKKSYWVTPRPIEGTLRYRGPSTGENITFKWYGTPGESEGLTDYTYLSWSWIDKTGGGIVRAIVREGDTFYPCNVKRITSHALPQSECDADGKTCSDGWVKAMYGMVYQDGHHYHGWLVHSHRFEDQPVVHHVAQKNP